MRSASTTPRSIRGTDPDDYDRVMGVTSVGPQETAMSGEENANDFVDDQEGVANNSGDVDETADPRQNATCKIMHIYRGTSKHAKYKDLGPPPKKKNQTSNSNKKQNDKSVSKERGEMARKQAGKTRKRGRNLMDIGSYRHRTEPAAMLATLSEHRKPDRLSGLLRLRVQSRSRTRLRIAAPIAFLFRACVKGALALWHHNHAVELPGEGPTAVEGAKQR